MMQLGKVLPQDVSLEEIVICSVINNLKDFSLAIQILDTDDFYKESHQVIFNSMKRIYSDGKQTDMVNLISDLRRNGEIEKVGGDVSIINLAQKMTGVGDTESYCMRVKDISIKRKSIYMVYELSKAAYQENTSGIEILAKVITESEKLYQSAFRMKTETFEEQLKKAVDEIGKNKSGLVGLDTGFHELNKRTNGLQGPDMIVLAAGPGEGKSTLALNIAKQVSKSKGVLFFALEMTAKQLVNRVIADVNELSVNDLKKGKDFTGANIDVLGVWERLRATQTEKLRLYTYDKEITSINDIIAISKTEKERKDVGLIVIDYLQLVPCGDARAKTRDAEIGIITRKLKQLAIQINVPVLVLSQLNRDKNRKNYKLTDLRESGNIEQDADAVWFIWRPHSHNQDFYFMDGMEVDCDKEDAFLKIAKFRDGETCEFRMKFKGGASKFVDYHQNTEDVDLVQLGTNLPF